MHLQWVLYIFTLCFSFPLLGLDELTPQQRELVEIEKKIQTIKERLQEKRLIEIKEEVEGQEFMIADWEAYRRELERIRKEEEEENRIKIEIKLLEQRKAFLLTHPTATLSFNLKK